MTLTAHPTGGAEVSWNGACSGHELVCHVTAGQTSDRVRVTFSLCEVPRLRGKPLAKAKNAVRRNHCSVGSVSRRPSRTVARGRVISEQPGAGTKKPAGTKVALVVSRGSRR